MKSFSQFLKEQNEGQAPQGVIFKGDKVAYVGAEHANPIKLSDELLGRVKTIGDKYGYWYEGSGGDADTNSKTFGPKSSYKGSWDDDGFNKEVKGFPYEFIYTLFANTEVNGQKKSITDPTLTIFDSILINQKKFSYFKDRKFTAEDLTKFLSSASEKTVNFIELSKQKATKENVNAFIDKGEELSWPKNWEEYPNNAGKLAYKANRSRDEYLAKQESGVYFAGAGHLKELIKVDKSLKLIGGEDID